MIFGGGADAVDGSEREAREKASLTMNGLGRFPSVPAKVCQRDHLTGTRMIVTYQSC
jgi:hypothetical protein